MNYADFVSQPNGFPLESDATLGFMQDDYQGAINGLAGLAGGNKVIVSGMKDTGASVSNGWLILNGELMRFEGGAKQSNIVIETNVVQKQNDGGTLVDRYFTKTAKFGNGTGAVPYSELIRIETLQSMTQRLLLNFQMEPEIILQGCLVSNVTTGPNNCDISAGIAVVNGKFIDVSAYSGGYPVWLNEFGQWVNTQPADNFIKFDPFTSQYTKDVNYRYNAQMGEFRDLAILPSELDNTGLGKWRLKGWALANGQNGTVDRRSRFQVGYDDRNSPPGGQDAFKWDVKYNTPGEQGSSLPRNITLDHLPVKVTTVKAGTGAADIVQYDATANPLTLNIQPPFRVVVTLQRI